MQGRGRGVERGEGGLRREHGDRGRNVIGLGW